MVLYFVGLGLGNEKDITLRGLEAVRSCDEVFLESYTSILGVDRAALEELYGVKMTIADRELVESGADAILDAAERGNSALLVVGDPFCATTHDDLNLRALERGIEVQVIHNASIMNAAACCGLQLYKFGQTVSIPFFNEDWKPDSFYDKIRFNASGGLHTLCLLDIKVKEPDLKALATGRVRWLPPRFMSVAVALEQLLEVESRRGEGVISEDSLCVGLARVGQTTQKIAFGRVADVMKVDMGEPLHSLVLVGSMSEFETEVTARHAAEIVVDEVAVELPSDDVVVLVSKFPTPGASKTRLIGELGEEGAADFARAAISDLVQRLAAVGDKRVLLYAPADAEDGFAQLLRDAGVEEAWQLQAMASADDLSSPDLGAKLAAAYTTQRALTSGAVAFIGMDTVDLPLSELEAAFAAASEDKARLCFAGDGGYTLISLPASAPAVVFDGVEWSTARTGDSQIEALAREAVEFRLGGTYEDVDEPSDLRALHDRLAADAELAAAAPRVASLLATHYAPA